jgi:hypothetical protein
LYPFTNKYCLRSKISKKIKPSHLFYVLYFKFLYNYFLNFVVPKINSKMVNSKMMVLRERKLMLMGYSLDIVACCWSSGGQEREKADVTWARVKYSQATTEISLILSPILLEFVSQPVKSRLQTNNSFYFSSSSS